MPDISTFYPPAASVDDQNQTPNALVWTGTAAQYAALGSKDANTLYLVTP